MIHLINIKIIIHKFLNCLNSKFITQNIIICGSYIKTKWKKNLFQLWERKRETKPGKALISWILKWGSLFWLCTFVGIGYQHIAPWSWNLEMKSRRKMYRLLPCIHLKHNAHLYLLESLLLAVTRESLT